MFAENLRAFRLLFVLQAKVSRRIEFDSQRVRIFMLFQEMLGVFGRQVFHHIFRDAHTVLVQTRLVDIRIGRTFQFARHALIGKFVFELMFNHIGDDLVMRMVERIMNRFTCGGRFTFGGFVVGTAG